MTNSNYQIILDNMRESASLVKRLGRLWQLPNTEQVQRRRASIRSRLMFLQCSNEAIEQIDPYIPQAL